MEGIFTAIYKVYEDKRDVEDVLLTTSDEAYLFSEDILVEIDPVRSDKVAHTLWRKFGEEDYLRICYSLTCSDEEKAQAIFHTVSQGIAHKLRPGHLYDAMADPFVNKAFKLANNAERECHHLEGFLRFQECENHILYARIGPRNNLLTFLMPHFSDRMPMESFLIYDTVHGKLGLHEKEKGWCLMENIWESDQQIRLHWSESETAYQELFRFFCHKITIKGRENPKLQNNLLPRRFQDFMTEFE